MEYLNGKTFLKEIKIKTAIILPTRKWPNCRGLKVCVIMFNSQNSNKLQVFMKAECYAISQLFIIIKSPELPKRQPRAKCKHSMWYLHPLNTIPLYNDKNKQSIATHKNIVISSKHVGEWNEPDKK